MRSACSRVSSASDFILLRDHREASTVLPGACRFNACIQGQQFQGAQLGEDMLHRFDDIVARAGKAADQPT